METFASKLVQKRKEKGLSQDDVGKLISKSRQTIAHYESGRVQPSLDDLVIIADALGCTTDELLKKNYQNVSETETSKGMYLRMIEELSGQVLYLTKELGKPSGESSKRVGYNILAHNYKHISTNFGNTHLALCR